MEAYVRPGFTEDYVAVQRGETQAGPGGGEGRETAAIGRMRPHREDFGLVTRQF